MEYPIDFICNKANCLLGFLYRNLWRCPSNLKEYTSSTTSTSRTTSTSSTHSTSSTTGTAGTSGSGGTSSILLVLVVINNWFYQHLTTVCQSGIHTNIKWSTSLKWYSTGKFSLFWTNLGASTEMIHKLNWPSLQVKRKQARLIF